MQKRRFWIATPSFNSLRWLPCAVASVADQAGDGVAVHHHVQDGGSTDGAREWLADYAAKCASHPRAGYTFSYASAPDGGMYDALNIAWGKAPAGVDFLAHLNSDEQYLPGALQVAAESFARHPAWEVLLLDMIVTDPEGHYICHRRSLKPSSLNFRYTCGGMTAATFQRASVFQERGIGFDTQWRVVGDKVWYCSLYLAGVAIGHENRLVSVFMETGDNLGWSAKFHEEARRYAEQFLGGKAHWVQVVSKWNTLCRIFAEWGLKSPKDYALYTREDLGERRVFPVTHPTGLWRKKLRPGG